MSQENTTQDADSALLSIQREAEALDLASAPPDPNAPQQPAPAELAAQTQANGEIIEFVWSIAGGFLPAEIAERYGEAQRKAIAQTYTVVAIKRGWDLGGLLAEWGPEIALGAALLGPGVPVIVAKWREERARKGAANGSHQ